MVKARLYLYNIGKPSIQTVMAVIISKRVWVVHLVQSNLEDTAPFRHPLILSFLV